MHSSRPERPAWILREDGVEELVEALAAHPGRKDERSVHPFQPLTRTPGWVRHPLGVVDDTGDTDERRIEWTLFPVHQISNHVESGPDRPTAALLIHQVAAQSAPPPCVNPPH